MESVIAIAIGSQHSTTQHNARGCAFAASMTRHVGTLLVVLVWVVQAGVQRRAVLACEVGDDRREGPADHVGRGDVDRAPTLLGHVHTELCAAPDTNRVGSNPVVRFIPVAAHSTNHHTSTHHPQLHRTTCERRPKTAAAGVEQHTGHGARRAHKSGRSCVGIGASSWG